MNKDIKNLLKEANPETLIHALIFRWAETNAIDFSDKILKSDLQKYVYLEKGESYYFLFRLFQEKEIEVKLKNIEEVLEQLQDKKIKRSQGVVYTPNYIIDYLVQKSLEKFSSNQIRSLRILDPSCGSGGFLIRIAELLSEKYGINPIESFNSIIFGIDVDNNAIANAKMLIELYLLSKNLSSEDVSLNLIVEDTLLASRESILNLLNNPDGFDILVTNPPYVKLQNLNLDYRNKLEEKYPDFVIGSFSLAMLFVISGFDLLSRQGVLGYITQNNIFTSLAGKNVRKFLQEKSCILRIVDFGHKKIFKVNAYTCLLFLSKKPQDCFLYSNLSGLDEINSNALKDATFSELETGELDFKKWRLAKKNHLRNLEKIEGLHSRLRDIADIRVGFATLKDKVFLIRPIGISDGKYHIDNATIEKEITKPAIKVSEINIPSDLEGYNLRIIFPYKNIGGKYLIIQEDELREKYPGAYEYLLMNKNKLNRRDKGKKKYDEWYAWGRTQGMYAPGPKLLTKTFNKKPQFVLDQTDSLFCNGYSISLKHRELFAPIRRLETLQKILNSNIMYYYAKLTSFQIDGNYQCYQKNFIENFGIVPLSEAQEDEFLKLSFHKSNIFLANQYKISIDEIQEVIDS